MKIIQRIRNLWRLSEYQVNERSQIVKDYSIPKKKMAVILNDEEKKPIEEKEFNGGTS